MRKTIYILTLVILSSCNLYDRKEAVLMIDQDYVENYREFSPDSSMLLINYSLDLGAFGYGQSGTAILKLSDREVIATDDHPFWTANKNWASVNPAKSNNNYEQSTEVKLLVVGDKIFVASENCFTELIGVEKIEEEQMTFTLELKNGNSFIANGLLVKTEMVKCVN